VVSVLTLVPYCESLRDTVLPSGPLWIYLAVMASAAVLTLISTVLPAWFALRSRPAEAALTAE
jgi:putative ABC transport system permease protein